MAINIDNLQTFTDAELLKLYRHALAVGAAGEERQMSDGRRIRFPSQDNIWKTIKELENRIATSDSDGIALLKINDPA